MVHCGNRHVITSTLKGMTKKETELQNEQTQRLFIAQRLFIHMVAGLQT